MDKDKVIFDRLLAYFLLLVMKFWCHVPKSWMGVD